MLPLVLLAMGLVRSASRLKAHDGATTFVDCMITMCIPRPRTRHTAFIGCDIVWKANANISLSVTERSVCFHRMRGGLEKCNGHR